MAAMDLLADSTEGSAYRGFENAAATSRFRRFAPRFLRVLEFTLPHQRLDYSNEDIRSTRLDRRRSSRVDHRGSEVPER